MVAFIAIVIFVAVQLASAYAGLHYGERDREARRQAVVQEHYDAGLKDLNEGRYERAAAEFAYILQLDPENALAEQGAAEARARLAAKPTPTMEVVRSLTEQLLEEAKASYAAKDWVATARTLTQVRALDLDYERETVEEMLFTSLYNAGITFLEEDRLEEGISNLDQAIALRPLDTEAVNQRNLAARYLEALNYWGVDWEMCIERFEALYATHPAYKDVSQRLYQAYLTYAQYFSEQGEMCPAEIQYTQALRLYADAQVEQQRATAAQTCLMATPAPLNGMGPHLTPQPVAGFTMGRLAYPVYNQETEIYDVYALYADGRILRVSANADQPWWERGTGRAVYRDRISGGVGMVLPEEGVPLQLLSPAWQAWPTFSPDSLRIAYATTDATGEWYIYVANTNNTGEPLQLAPGWAPAWGASGSLAYTGCNTDGCGIIVDNPDDGQPGTRLTGSESDIAASWAPAGNMLAYMTNVAGNWDIFLLNPQGGVQQITSDTSDEGLPAWSPDGSRMAFVSNRGGTWAVYVMQTDGQNVQRILDLGASMPGWDNQRLSWAP
ncbi:MAG: PD40 domain-containing protein [Anaerolineae bacterium]|nr:PD40 domain-containing protein [Anaerolineae bacterium]